MKKLSIAAGVLVALVVLTLFGTRPVPDRIVQLLGGPHGGVDRIGGVRIRYRPPAGVSADALAARLHSHVHREGDVLVLEFPGVAEDQIPNLLGVLVDGGLEMREVIESELAVDLMLYAADGVALDTDQWVSEDGGAHHHIQFLYAAQREALEQTIANAATQGVHPEGELVFEHVDGPRGKYWRTHQLGREVVIDGGMIALATKSFDPNTNRPIVLLDFTPEGARRFCDVTARLVGRKLATVLGGTVRSAPIINSRICGGRASITMGADLDDVEREASLLAAVLSQGGLPRGGRAEDARWQPPASAAMQEWIGRLLLALLAGLAAAGVVAAALRYARPTLRPAPAPVAGTFPWRRLAVTALAPIAMLAGNEFILPHINGVEFAHVMRSSDTGPISVFALGVMPVLTSFVCVELVALLVPRLRWRRHDPVGRARLGQAVAIVAVVIALVQGFFVALYFESLARSGMELVTAPGWTFRLLTMTSLTAGTLLLAALAGIITVHGLGNGYGMLLTSGFVIATARPILDGPAHFLDRPHLFGACVLAAIAAITWAMLRMRVRGDDRQLALRLPTSSIAPLSDAGGLAIIVGTLAAVGLGESLFDVMAWVDRTRGSTLVYFALVVGFVPLWGWLLARPHVLERPAMQAGLSPPTRAMWLRATLLSGVGIALIAALGRLGKHTFATPVLTMIATAYVLDLVADARAHREKLVAVFALHQIQRAGIVERVLGDAGIRYHIHATHLRALFAFFAPWAPAVVLVPEADVASARDKLDAAFREARTKLPVAAVRDDTV